MRKGWLPVVCVAWLFYAGCDIAEKEECDYNPNRDAAVVYIHAENIYRDVFNIVWMACTDTLLLQTGSSSVFGSVATYDSIPVKKITVDYGNYVKICPDNRYRLGSIEIEMSGDLLSKGTVINVRFSDDYLQSDARDVYPDAKPYFIHANAVSIVDEGMGDDGRPLFSYSVTGGTVSDTVKVINTFNTSKTIEWTGDDDTPYDPDEEFLVVEGTSTGEITACTSFQATVLEPLQDHLDCPWLTAGKIALTTGDLRFHTAEVDLVTADGCNSLVYFIYDDVILYAAMK
jgi:hypothetical protein